MAEPKLITGVAVDAQPLPFEIVTSRYANRALAQLPYLPVGITLGMPRFRLAYAVAANLSSLAPDSWMFRQLRDDEQAYRQAMIDKLERIGFAAVRAQLEEISRQHGDRGLALLCFEDLRQPGEWCHRRMVADWLSFYTGQPVLELAAPGARPRRQLDLGL